jgi:hypothetical protein
MMVTSTAAVGTSLALSAARNVGTAVVGTAELGAAGLALEGAGALAEFIAALDGFGYQVGEEFATLTAQDGELFITRAGWPAHVVKLKVAHNN